MESGRSYDGANRKAAGSMQQSIGYGCPLEGKAARIKHFDFGKAAAQ